MSGAKLVGMGVQGGGSLEEVRVEMGRRTQEEAAKSV